jgi:hypothetical protein
MAVRQQNIVYAYNLVRRLADIEAYIKLRYPHDRLFARD